MVLLFNCQEFIPEILELGEFSLLYFNGQYSHALRKFNTSGDFRVQSEWGGGHEALPETETNLNILKPFAEAVLEACPFKDLLYARFLEIFFFIF